MIWLKRQDKAYVFGLTYTPSQRWVPSWYPRSRISGFYPKYSCFALLPSRNYSVRRRRSISRHLLCLASLSEMVLHEVLSQRLKVIRKMILYMPQGNHSFAVHLPTFLEEDLSFLCTRGGTVILMSARHTCDAYLLQAGPTMLMFHGASLN